MFIPFAFGRMKGHPTFFRATNPLAFREEGCHLAREMIPLVALGLLLAAPPGIHIGPKKEKNHGVEGLGVPLVAFNTDEGFGFGAAGGVYFYGNGSSPPYIAALSAQVFFTTGGVQSHFLSLDAPHLFEKFRLEAHVEYDRALFAPFYGVGNQSAPGVAGAPDDPRYSFHSTSPMAWVRFRFHPFPDQGLQPYVGYHFRYSSVHPYTDSALAKAAPLGLSGGTSGEISVGFIWDTRDDEGDTTSGGLLDAELRVSDPFTGTRFGYAGFTLGVRRFVPLWRHELIFAQRVLFDGLVGQVPFWEWTRFGGIGGTEGIGGMFSVRGVPEDRYQGDVKVVSNSELRFYPFTLPVLGAPLKIGAVAFLDLGRVWQPGARDGSFWEWHSGAGGGLRLVRGEAVIRLDCGVALETGHVGLYVAFGQMF